MGSWATRMHWFEAGAWSDVEEKERVTDGCVVKSEKVEKRRKEAEDTDLEVQNITRGRDPV